MAIKGDPASSTAKWVNRLSGATAEITAGVQKVQTSPGQLAAAKHQKWLQSVTESAAKWRRNTGRVTLEDWRTMMVNVGIPRIAQGAQQKQAKMQAFLTEFYPHLEALQRKLDSAPDATFEDRINRAVIAMRHNRDFKRGGAGAA